MTGFWIRFLLATSHIDKIFVTKNQKTLTSRFTSRSVSVFTASSKNLFGEGRLSTGLCLHQILMFFYMLFFSFIICLKSFDRFMRHIANKNYCTWYQAPHFTSGDSNVHCNSLNYQNIIIRIENFCNTEILLSVLTNLMSLRFTISKLFDFSLV